MIMKHSLISTIIIGHYRWYTFAQLLFTIDMISPVLLTALRLTMIDPGYGNGVPSSVRIFPELSTEIGSKTLEFSTEINVEFT